MEKGRIEFVDPSFRPTPSKGSFECTVVVRDRKFVTDLEWLNGADAGWAFADGNRYHLKGKIVTEDGYVINECQELPASTDPDECPKLDAISEAMCAHIDHDAALFDVLSEFYDKAQPKWIPIKGRDDLPEDGVYLWTCKFGDKLDVRKIQLLTMPNGERRVGPGVNLNLDGVLAYQRLPKPYIPA